VLEDALKALHKGVSPQALLKAHLHKDDEDSDDEDDEDERDNESDDDDSGGDSNDASGGHYNPDEPRDYHGRWTTGGVSNAQSPDDSSGSGSGNSIADGTSNTAPTQPASTNSASSENGSGNGTDTTQVAGPLTPVSNTQVVPSDNTPAHAVPVTLSDGSVVANPVTGSPIQMPSNVLLSDNIKFGETIADLPSKLDNSSSNNNDLSFRETAMTAAFMPNGSMDYQRIDSNRTDSNGNPLINRDYIDFGNYNYGAVGAAAGYSLSQLLDAGAIVNARNILTPNVGMVLNPFDATDATPWLSNPRNDMFITMGYNAYKAGKIKASEH
jgi:hypothetical protein